MRIPRDTTCEGEIQLAEFQSPSLETTITTETPTVDNIEQSIAFASDPDYILFAHSVMQKLQLNDQIRIAMRKITSNSLNAGMLSSNFKATVQQFIAQDKTYSFKWNELIEIIAKLNSLNLTDDGIKYMCYQDRCDTLNKNPVLVARHFQYRVEVFFKEVVLNDPLGKTKCYAIHVEFQVRGSPHIHSFIWILSAPKLNIESKEEYIQWVDSIIRADMPDPVKEKQLFDLVKTFQLHRHSKTCRKYHNEKCRFHFRRLFSHRAIVAEPLPDNMPEEIKMQVLRNRNDLLSKVKCYIDTELNPSKKICMILLEVIMKM